MPDPATLDLAQMTLGALSGVLVGFTLGLVGGGGSILAVPLMIYLVGVPQPHVAIGTAALAVAANAAAGLANHARAGHVRWPCGLTFAGAGIVAVRETAGHDHSVDALQVGVGMPQIHRLGTGAANRTGGVDVIKRPREGDDSDADAHG